MGLDTSHDCWHGSYSSFNAFREQIAKALDIPIGLMDGYCDKRIIESAIGDSPKWQREILDNNLFKYLPIYWEVLLPDAIHVLLTHSDCDGEIAVKDLLPLAERLEAIAHLLPVSTSEFRFDMQSKARQFATGLRLAADLGEVVEFH